MHALEHDWGGSGIDPERQQLARDIFVLQGKLHDRSMSLVGPAEPPSDLTMQQLRVLCFVAQEPGLSGQELGARLGVSAPTASGLVDRLVEKGLITRADDPDDRRVRRVHITAEAGNLMRQLDSTLDRSFTAVVQLLSREDLELIKLATQTLVDAMARAEEIAAAGGDQAQTASPSIR